MNLKNFMKTPYWLMVGLASILLASGGIFAYNAFADDSSNHTKLDDEQSRDHNMTNGITQKWGFGYPHNYNMSDFGNEKDNSHEGDYNGSSSNATTGSCGGESIVDYVGNGQTSSTLVRHNLGASPRIIYILDLTDQPNSNVDGITTVISTPKVVYAESGNDAYPPVPMPNTNVVNATTIDVGQIFNQISQLEFNAKAVNANGTSYELIAVNFPSSTCGGSSHSSEDDDHHDDG